MQTLRNLFKKRESNPQTIDLYSNALYESFENYPSPVFIKEKDGELFQNFAMRQLSVHPEDILANLQPYSPQIYESFVGNQYFQVFFHRVDSANRSRIIVQLLEIEHLAPISRLSIQTSHKSFSNLGKSISEEVLKAHKIFKSSHVALSFKDGLENSVDFDGDSDLIKQNVRKVFIYLFQTTKDQSYRNKSIELKTYKKDERLFFDFFVPSLQLSKASLSQKLSLFEYGTLGISDILKGFESDFEDYYLRASLKNIFLNQDKSGFLIRVSLSSKAIE